MTTIKNPKILAVDDIPDNLYLLEVLLGDEKDYQLSCVDNGQSAIESVQNSPPDLILMDVGMPDINGLEVTRRIRQIDDLPHIPILLVTCHDAAITQQGLQAGADGIIHKPFDIQTLLDRVETSLSHGCECGCGCEP